MNEFDCVVKEVKKILLNELVVNEKVKYDSECLIETYLSNNFSTPDELNGLDTLVSFLRKEDYENCIKIILTLLRTTDNRAEKIISHKYKCVWVCNPKVASRSIIDYFLKHDDTAKLIKGCSLENVLKKHPEVSSFYKFAFVRDPYKRCFSAYSDKILNRNNNQNIKKIFHDKIFGIHQDMSFLDFLEWLNGTFGRVRWGDRHFIPQVEQFKVGSRVFLDFVGRHESLVDDFEIVLKKIGAPQANLPRRNQTSLREDDFSYKEKQLMQKYYEEDFKQFGYERNG